MGHYFLVQYAGHTGHNGLYIQLHSIEERNILQFTRFPVRSSIFESEALMLSDYRLTDGQTDIMEHRSSCAVKSMFQIIIQFFFV